MTPSRTRSVLTSLSLWVLIALVGGVAAGAAAQAYGIPGGTGTIAVVDALGQLWLNALRMTIIPLVFSLLVTGIASTLRYNTGAMWRYYHAYGAYAGSAPERRGAAAFTPSTAIAADIASPRNTATITRGGFGASARGFSSSS